LKGEELFREVNRDLYVDVAEKDLQKYIQYLWSLFDHVNLQESNNAKIENEIRETKESILETINEKGESKDIWKALDLSLEIIKSNKESDEFDRVYAIEQSLLKISQKGKAEDYIKLLEFKNHIKEDSYRNETYFNILLKLKSKLLWKEFLKKKIKPVKIKLLKIEPSEDLTYLKKAPKSIYHVWLTYRSLIQPYEELSEYNVEKKRYPYSSFSKEYYNGIYSYLKVKKINIIQHLNKYTWGSWCGTGSEGFTNSKNRSRTIGLLEEKKYLNALASTFYNYNYFRPSEKDDGTHNSREHISYLKHLGLDWEMLYMGAYLDGQTNGSEALGYFGSIKTAKYLIQLRTIIDNFKYKRAAYYFMVSSFINSDSIPEKLRNYKIEIDPKLKDELFQILVDSIDKEINIDNLKGLTNIIGNCKRDDRIPPLKKLLKSKYISVRNLAAVHLKSAGVSESFKPVKEEYDFRLFHNDKIMKTGTIDYEIIGENDTHSKSHKLKSEMISIHVDKFNDPNNLIEHIIFKGKYDKELNTPYFAYKMFPPFKESQLNDIKINTYTMEFLINLPQDYKKKESFVTMKVSRENNIKYRNNDFYICEFPLSESFHFPNLGEGHYQFELFLTGTGKWKSDIIDFSMNQSIYVDFSLGSDLRFSIHKTSESGEYFSPYYELHRINMGSEIEIEQTNKYEYRDLLSKTEKENLPQYRGLESGDYIFRIFSTENYNARFSDSDYSNQFFQKESDYKHEGFSKKFQINDDSPAIINLGEIKLKTIISK